MKESDSLVSVIVPVYGTEEYLPKCIESICKQTHKNIQIILVDDDSPDRCPEICEEYAKKDERIIVFHQKNKGVSGARNTGMKHAAGDYFMFVDSDDELYENAVEVLLQDACKYNADIVSAVKRTVAKQGKSKKDLEDEKIIVYEQEEPLLLSLAGDVNTNSACAKLFKTSFVKGIFFEEGKNIQEDGFFIFQCYRKKPILVQHDVYVYQYNFREESGSHQLFSDKYLAMLYYCNRKKDIIFKEFPQYIEKMYNMEVRTNLQFLDMLCSSKDKKYKNTHKKSVEVVKELYKYHRPINEHHKKLAWIVKKGLYPLYKFAVRLKYYR